jgi:hypothetical protein
LRYYSENGFNIKIKNNLDEEISLEQLVEQYFGYPENYFIKEQLSNITKTTSVDEKNNFNKDGSSE